jgi:hypothetical protein
VLATTGRVQAVVLSGIAPQANPVSRFCTLGERFQVRMLSGRSTLQRISTMVSMADGSAAARTIMAVRSSRRAQRAHYPRRYISPSVWQVRH